MVQTELTCLPISPPASFPLSPPITPQAQLPTIYLEQHGIDAATPIVPPSASALASPSPVLQPEIPSSAPLLATVPDEAATSRFRAPLTDLELNQLLKIMLELMVVQMAGLVYDVSTHLLRLIALLAMYTIYL